MPYRVAILPAALRQLVRLPKPDQKRIREKIDHLAHEPYPPEVKKLQGNQELFRIRSGNYRVIYRVDRDRLVVLVVTVGHRREVYRGLQA